MQAPTVIESPKNCMASLYAGTAGAQALAPGASYTPEKVAWPASASLRLKSCMWWRPAASGCG